MDKLDSRPFRETNFDNQLITTRTSLNFEPLKVAVRVLNEEMRDLHLKQSYIKDILIEMSNDEFQADTLLRFENL